MDTEYLNSLKTIEDFYHQPSNQKLTVSDFVYQKIQKNRLYLEDKIKTPGALFYGINTGFGSLCNIQISEHDLEILQENLVLSHACGMGQKLPEHLCRLILLLKIKNFTAAVSGVRPLIVQRLTDMYNAGVIPVVYEMGSLGASGDLAPLAHLSLPLLGKGDVYYKGKVQPAADVLAALGWDPIILKAKEGLALLNGTQFSLAFSAYICTRAFKLFDLWNKTAALSMEAFACSISPFDPSIHAIRPHAGQVLTASKIYELLDSTDMRKANYSVQDPYSFRCVPQVHGASYMAFCHAKEVIETEINSATDNPNIFDQEDKILSGGNFHAQPLALILDYMALALAELGNISERRVYQLINGDRDLPAFLAPEPGLNSGFMIAQYTAASIVSQNKQYATPASVDSIVSSKGQEDHVSMAANAATKCYKILENVEMLLAIELLTACQAFEFRRPAVTSPELEALFIEVQTRIPFMKEDRLLHDDLMICLDIVKKSLENQPFSH